MTNRGATRFRVVRTVLICLAAAGARLDATTVIVHFEGVMNPMSIQRTVSDAAGWVTTEVGLFHFTRIGGDHPGLQGPDLYGFCIEPREFVSPGSNYTYDFAELKFGTTNIGGMGEAKANLLRELYGRYYPLFLPSISALESRALQIATWEIVRESSGVLDVLTGTTQFRNPADPAALTLAQTYLSSLNGSGPMLGDAFAMIRVGAQDIVFQDAPEPATLALTGAALLLIGLRRRRRRN